MTDVDSYLVSESSERQMRLPELASRRVWRRRYEVVLRSPTSPLWWLRFLRRIGSDSARYLRPATACSIWVMCLTPLSSSPFQLLSDDLSRQGKENPRRRYQRGPQVAAATLSAFGTIAVALTVVKVELARGYLAIPLLVGLFGLLASHQLARGILPPNAGVDIASPLCSSPVTGARPVPWRTRLLELLNTGIPSSHVLRWSTPSIATIGRRHRSSLSVRRLSRGRHPGIGCRRGRHHCHRPPRSPLDKRVVMAVGEARRRPIRVPGTGGPGRTR